MDQKKVDVCLEAARKYIEDYARNKKRYRTNHLKICSYNYLFSSWELILYDGVDMMYDFMWYERNDGDILMFVYEEVDMIPIQIEKEEEDKEEEDDEEEED